MKNLPKIGWIALFFLALTAQGAVTVTRIAQGNCAAHALFIMSDGSLWGMGNHSCGQLGDGQPDTLTWWMYLCTNKPEQIVASNVVAVASGAYFSLFLKSDGSLWGMGSSDWGQLGLGAIYWTNSPTQIVPRGVTAIAAGFDHSLFLKSDGSLWVMGDNSYGQLGDGSYDSTNRPQKIVARGVEAIAAAGRHSLFLKTDGSLWGMGANDCGQLGDGTTDDTNRPIKIVEADSRIAAENRFYNRLLKNDFSAAFLCKNPNDVDGQYFNKWFSKHPDNHPDPIPKQSRIIAIAAGGSWNGIGHSLFLKSDGSLWGMGCNWGGQLGTNNCGDNVILPEEIVSNNVVAMSAGIAYSLFVTSDGKLWGMGNNDYGQLGDGTCLSVQQPEVIVSNGVTIAAALGGFSLFLKTDGELWGMGYNGQGQLGDGFWQGLSAVTSPEQIFPRPQPILALTIVDGTNLQCTAPCGFAGDFCLLTSTNLNEHVNQWRPVCTNTIRYRFARVFTATFTNAAVPGDHQFYLLQSQ